MQGSVPFQQTYEITAHATLNDEGLRAFSQVRQLSLRDGRERNGAYLVQDGQIYDLAVTAVGDTHSVMATDYLTAFHTHPRTKESVSATDMVVTLTNPREFRRDGRITMIYSRNLMVSNYEIWSYAPTDGAIRLMMDPSFNHRTIMNAIYWTASIVVTQYARAVISLATYRSMIRNLDLGFARYQLASDPTIERQITSPHPNGVPPQFGDFDSYKRLSQDPGMARLFSNGDVGFDVRREHVWSDEIACMPALSDPGVSKREVEAAVRRYFGDDAPPSPRDGDSQGASTALMIIAVGAVKDE